MSESTTTKFKLAAYSLRHLKSEGVGREGDRWSGWLQIGDLKIVKLNEDGTGAELRWDWQPGPTGARRHDDFRAAVAQWVQELIPGTTIKEYVEPESAFITLAMHHVALVGKVAIDELKLRYVKPKETMPPNWSTLENRLSRMLHGMKLGYGAMMSLQCPLDGLTNWQREAILKIESWIGEGRIAVDNWRLLDDKLNNAMSPAWVNYTGEDTPEAEELKLGFGNMAYTKEWLSTTEKPDILRIYHVKATYEPSPGAKLCQDCSGTGEVEGMGSRADCPSCDGKGSR